MTITTLLKFIRERYHQPEKMPIRYRFVHPLCQGSLSLAVVHQENCCYILHAAAILLLCQWCLRNQDFAHAVMQSLAFSRSQPRHAFLSYHFRETTLIFLLFIFNFIGEAALRHLEMPPNSLLMCRKIKAAPLLGQRLERNKPFL